MHSAWYRVNSGLTFAGTVLAVLCALISATDYFHEAHPVVDCAFVGSEGLQREFGHDRAYVVLDVGADLRSEFTWNTKQLYVFVNVEFATPANEVNQMVIWNAIIRSKEDAALRLPTLRQQYPFSISDQGFGLRGREFNVTVAWNVMPRVGGLYTRSRTFSGFRLPEEYVEPEKGSIRSGGAQYAAAAAE